MNARGKVNVILTVRLGHNCTTAVSVNASDTLFEWETHLYSYYMPWSCASAGHLLNKHNGCSWILLQSGFPIFRLNLWQRTAARKNGFRRYQLKQSTLTNYYHCGYAMPHAILDMANRASKEAFLALVPLYLECAWRINSDLLYHLRSSAQTGVKIWKRLSRHREVPISWNEE
jgi:hypothetical protein